MQTGRGCVVAARMSSCGDGCAGVLASVGYALAAEAGSVDEALRLVREHRPALLLADAVLPGGDGMSLARRINAAPLTTYPDILLAVPAGLALPGAEDLASLGAAVIPKPLTAAAIGEAVDGLHAGPVRLPPKKAARLTALLDALGLPDHPGREMLAVAVCLAWRDRRRLGNLRDEIYPAAGQALGKSGAQAERAIRHAIDVAWRTGEIEQQHRIFGDTVDARRGRPTCGEMIAQLADILRWEG